MISYPFTLGFVAVLNGMSHASVVSLTCKFVKITLLTVFLEILPIIVESGNMTVIARTYYATSLCYVALKVYQTDFSNL